MRRRSAVLRAGLKRRPAREKWRGTSDISIRFDNGASLFLGNRLTPKAKTAAVQRELVNDTLLRYNPEIVSAAKEALASLMEREARTMPLPRRRA